MKERRNRGRRFDVDQGAEEVCPGCAEFEDSVECRRRDACLAVIHAGLKLIASVWMENTGFNLPLVQ